MPYKRPVTITIKAHSTDQYGYTTETSTVLLSGDRMVENISASSDPYINNILTTQNVYIVKIEKGDSLNDIMQAIQDGSTIEVSFNHGGVDLLCDIKKAQPYVRPVLRRIADLYCVSSSTTS